MNWDDLQNFLAIARHGSLSGAARSLGVTQPTMGRRLAALEANLGTRLLLRTPEGFVLTALGEQMLARAERMEEEAYAAQLLARSCDARLEGTVRLTTVDTLAGAFVAPAMLDLQREHPGIVVELLAATQSLNLSRREADIAIRMTRFEGDLIVARRIGTLALSFYTVRTQPEPQRVITVLDDQAHLPEARAMAEQFAHLPVGLKSNSREVQHDAACHGGGVAMLPRFRADHDERLLRIRTELPDLRRDIWLGVHADLHKMPRMRSTIDALVAHFASKAQLLDPDG
ncbi:LysR family transcriptional regulator [Aurantiacibacter xanthus]|uniref:LysR family transcriptional regulator n=1 Tax=Aurantiacibacter xanthus TaxID=1784712 RepID=A0A3A1P7S9_9SPHN|nr:LysR family transcriptional regulator [Aurantiacibacter xanthus]RIV89915.1 LysR family transcriptional regulator [Aurantiacibacter xanthus]